MLERMLEDAHEELEEFLEEIVPFGEMFGHHGPLETKAQRKAKKYLPLLFAFKRLNEAHEAHGKGLPYRLPSEARWERIREIPSFSIHEGLMDALHAMGRANPCLLPLVHEAADALHTSLSKVDPGLKDEVYLALEGLVKAMDQGTVEPPKPRTPLPAARLMARFLPPWSWALLSLEGGGGELLVEGYREMAWGARIEPNCTLPSGLPCPSSEGEPLFLHAVEGNPLKAFATWAHLVSLGLEATAATKPIPYPGGYGGILAHPARVDWGEVERVIDNYLAEEGWMVLLVREEDAGGPDPTGLRERLVDWGHVLGAIRLDPKRYGIGGVVLLLSNGGNPERDLLVADLDRVEDPLDWAEAEEEISYSIRNRLVRGLVRWVSYGEMASNGFSLNPADYIP